MAIDLRDKSYIDHADIMGLNFINPACPFVFRRHYRQGLRSHVMELLAADDVRRESRGILVDGIRRFPKARPLKIFRLFRTRLNTYAQARAEIDRVKLVEAYLSPGRMARSNEFIVDYDGPQGREMILCGLQEFVDGEILDPWTMLDQGAFFSFMHARLQTHDDFAPAALPRWITRARGRAAVFIHSIKLMIAETGHCPDLAGVGNLMMTPTGDIKLVDINNIFEMPEGDAIILDDKGYPVGDKSIEALSLLERQFLDRPVDMNEPVYRVFLKPERMARAQSAEKMFRKNNKIQA